MMSFTLVSIINQPSGLLSPPPSGNKSVPSSSEEHTKGYPADRGPPGADGRQRGLRPLRQVAGSDGEVQKGAGPLPQV